MFSDRPRILQSSDRLLDGAREGREVQRLFGALLFSLIALTAASAPRAEMCSGEYQSGARRLSKEERAKDEARRVRDMERAEAAERARQAAEETERQAQAARRAAQPLGARLIEDRCTTCHPAAAFAGERRGRLGWWAVVLRMEIFNGARLAPGESRPIVDYLVDQQSATSVRVALEWAVLAGGTATAAFLGTWMGRLARRRSS